MGYHITGWRGSYRKNIAGIRRKTARIAVNTYELGM